MLRRRTYSIDELYKLVSKLEKENQKLKQTLEDLNISYDLEDVSSKTIQKEMKSSTHHIKKENDNFNIDRTQLKDIEELTPDDITKPVAEKVENFLKKSGNNPYVHMNEGYIVVVRMNGEIDVTEALCKYVRKRIEMPRR